MLLSICAMKTGRRKCMRCNLQWYRGHTSVYGFLILGSILGPLNSFTFKTSPMNSSAALNKLASPHFLWTEMAFWVSSAVVSTSHRVCVLVTLCMHMWCRRPHSPSPFVGGPANGNCSRWVSWTAPGCVTCHTCHASVTHFRPILGKVVEVTLVTSPKHVYKFPC